MSMHSSESDPSDDQTRPHTLSFVRRTTFISEKSLLPLALAAAGLLLAALPAVAKPKHPAGPIAVIMNSGSTNTTGYRIVVSPDGRTQSEVTGLMTTGPVPKAKLAVLPIAQVKKLFQDLGAAMPLTSLPVRHGMRSASFGTQTTITYEAQTSPDLTFASNLHTAALKADIDSITKALHIGNAPRRPIVIEKYPATLNGAKN